MTRCYTGVGSRETPENVQAKMTQLAYMLDTCGWILRSGGATGADTAFEFGAGPTAEIYLPWQGFNEHPSPLYGVSGRAVLLAREVHPNWGALSEESKALHARNCYQVLGRNLDAPSDFLVCWTPDGCEKEADRGPETGGTATAIVLARRHNVPVFNLKNPESRNRLGSYLLASVPMITPKWINRWLGETNANP